MREICSELRERASLIQREIEFETTRFDMRVAQLRTDQEGKLKDLRAQLGAVNGLLNFANYRHNARLAVARALALAATAEITAAAAARQFLQNPEAPALKPD